MNCKVLVTGGTGLVGAHLLYKLIQQNFEVRALKRPGSDFKAVKDVFGFYESDEQEIERLFNHIEWTDGDLTDYYSLTDALEGIEKVYHAAAYVSFSSRKKEDIFSVNQQGTANLMDACIEKKVSKLCHVSSIGALGSTTNGQLIDEDTNWHIHKQRSNYSMSKFNAEMEVWRASKESLPVVIVNPGVIVGPGNPDRSSSAIFKQARKGFRFYPPGINAFVDVRDVVNSIFLLMESNIVNERFIVVSENIPFKDFLTQLSKSLQVTKPQVEVPRWLAELAWRLESVRSFVMCREPLITKETIRATYSRSMYSSSKFIKQFNYTFIPINQSIQETSGWMQKQNRGKK
jgi:dihydroflavonol-4-reductase